MLLYIAGDGVSKGGAASFLSGTPFAHTIASDMIVVKSTLIILTHFLAPPFNQGKSGSTPSLAIL